MNIEHRTSNIERRSGNYEYTEELMGLFATRFKMAEKK